MAKRRRRSGGTQARCLKKCMRTGKTHAKAKPGKRTKKACAARCHRHMNPPTRYWY